MFRVKFTILSSEGDLLFQEGVPFQMEDDVNGFVEALSSWLRQNSNSGYYYHLSIYYPPDWLYSPNRTLSWKFLISSNTWEFLSNV